MSKADSRLEAVLGQLSRAHFIASKDLRHIVSGRSIPTTSAVRQILEQVGPIMPQARVLVIGSGAGYLPAVLSRLAGKVVVIERDDHIASIARANFESAGLANIQLLLGDGEAGAADLAPFDLIVCSCFLSDITELLTQLDGRGSLYCLEGGDALAPSLVRYKNDDEGQERRTELGVVIFTRDSGEVLIDLGYIDEKALEQARAEAERRKQPVLKLLQGKLGVEDAEFYRDLARQHGLELVLADEVLRQLDVKLFQRFSKTFLDNQRVMPVRVKDDELLLATDNPDAQVEDIARMQPYASLRRVLVTPTDFKRIWQALELTERSKSMLSWKEASQPVESNLSDDLLDASSKEISHYLVSIYEAILLDAVSANASDVHVERYGDRIRIRIRVDGELRNLEHYKLTPRDHAGLINVIKVRAEINIAERRLPQGGRSHMRVGSTNYDLRVQIQPSLHGEHAVIRLLSQTGRVLGLDELGMASRVASFYRRLLDNPAGLVLVVGPTGSGKSTTLYAALQNLADDGRRKVITVEDPIEYSIDNIQQTRVRSDIGFNFADAMRSFVRQDPDVILVGEIRDQETALEAIRASQTGHLVLSTLHANDAVDALQRMYDLGTHPNSIASELLAVIAQRLAKRICSECREPAEPDPVILRELFPERVPTGFRCYQGRGCKVCGGRGTKGRVAVVEYMQANDDIRNLISLQPPVGELRWQALDSGLITMRDSALDHVIHGVIPMSELPRILPQDRMAPEQRGGRRKEL
jgi:type IV pilus assembly protein PilB